MTAAMECTRHRRDVLPEHSNSASHPLPPLPTSEVPGTPAKVAILEERAAAWMALFHPDDVRIVARGAAIREASARRVL